MDFYEWRRAVNETLLNRCPWLGNTDMRCKRPPTDPEDPFYGFVVIGVEHDLGAVRLKRDLMYPEDHLPPPVAIGEQLAEEMRIALSQVPLTTPKEMEDE